MVKEERVWKLSWEKLFKIALKTYFERQKKIFYVSVTYVGVSHSIRLGIEKVV